MTETTKPAGRRALAMTTATIVSFSLTLFVGSLAVLSGRLPLGHLTMGQRLDVGALLFLTPVVALTLAVVFEASRIALTRSELPQPRQRRVIRWTPSGSDPEKLF